MIPTLSLDVLTPLAALAPVLAAVDDAALKGALVVALAAAAARTLLRHRPAAARHALWTGALAAHLVLIVAAPLLPPIALPAFRLPAFVVEERGGRTEEAAGRKEEGEGRKEQGAGRKERGEGRSEADRGHFPPSLLLPPSSSVTQPAVTSSRGDTLANRLIAIWLAGVLLVLARLALGTLRVRTLARVADRVTDPPTLSLAQRIAGRLGIARPITLLRGDRLTVPITWGVVYPVVLLPAESDGWNDERRRVVLVHELAHVKRLDALTQLVGQLVIALFWFDPLVWLAARRMRAEREHACDDYVLRDGTRPSLYANELLDMVRRLGTMSDSAASAPAFAALAMARRSEFEGRMLAILDPVTDRHTLSRPVLAAGTLSALALLVPLAAVRPLDARTRESAPAPTVAETPATTKAVVWPVERRSRGAPAPRPVPAVVAVPAAAATPAPRVPQAATPETLPVIYRCTKADVRSTNSTYAIHTDHERPGRNFIEHYAKRYGRCLHVVLVGRVSFTADERDVASLGPDGRVQLHERTLDWERALTVTPASDGTLRRSYMADGRPAPFDASAQAWVARLMQDLARESGVDVPSRVSRIRSRGGVPAVLADIAEIESSGAKRKHYEALLSGGALSAGEVDMVVRHAGRELSNSSGDLRAVLRQVPSGGARSVNGALEAAIANMSDGDKHQVLAGMLDSGDAPTLLVLLRLAERIGSDGDKASFLRRAAPRVLDGSAPLREAFFRTYATIGSDGDKQTVLVTALRRGQKSPALARDVIRGSSRIGSDGDKASVLLAVARGGLLTSSELREEYIKVARTIGSDSEYRSVIDAVLGGKSGA